MNISVIHILSEDKKQNNKTTDMINRLKPAQVLTVDSDMTYPELCRHVTDRLTGDYVTFINSGDSLDDGAFSALLRAERQFPEEAVYMVRKDIIDSKAKLGTKPKTGDFSDKAGAYPLGPIEFSGILNCHPFYYGGTFVRTDLFRRYLPRECYGAESECFALLSLCAEAGRMIYVPEVGYLGTVAKEGDLVFDPNLYDPYWYEGALIEHWIPFLEELRAAYGQVPEFVQYQLMFSIKNRLMGNQNNKNKHAIPEGREQDALRAIGAVLQLVDDRVMNNYRKHSEASVPDSMHWVLGILKYGKDYHFEKRLVEGEECYCAGEVVFNKVHALFTMIQFMEYENGVLTIDGTVHNLLWAMSDEIYLEMNGIRYPLTYNERYGNVKVYGISIYKRFGFSAAISMKDVKDGVLCCYADFGSERVQIDFNYDSHFSRISDAFKNNYWTFGKKPMYMMSHKDGGLRIRRSSPVGRIFKELALLTEMVCHPSKTNWIFAGIRMAYHVTKPFIHNKPVFMYIDKIYKAGDSAEYIYKYNAAKNPEIKHYYLVDKKAADYDRLVKAGYKPLVRGTPLHRLVFLMADMMVISNSTVFAFNDFHMANSRYIRDLVNFHVCCVQHGMSVQKIAVAQHRLRDNTRLYFCASKYEIENLSKPVYDYVGHDALKLTGVPRYDGLKDRSDKQIMISPTWRMQAAVPVRTNEGQQRDYNPKFKESTYFKVFNALINDPRLIAAAREYGYRIKYVLHPIVSAQVKDFDRNDFVDIIPAVGDMSYEDMFCESSLMVTDFSGIQFDFAYMRKPLVYLHHKDIPQHYEEGTFFYDTMAFGEICHDNDELIDVLIEYMENGCVMKEEYVRRADDFFHYSDHNNCERINKEMMDYFTAHVANQQ